MGRSAETLPSLTLAGPSLDRRAELRVEPDLLPRLLSVPGTRVLELRGDRVPVSEGPGGVELVLRPPQAGDSARLAMYLGQGPGDTQYLAVVGEPAPGAAGPGDPAQQDGGGPAWATLRQVATALSDLDAGVFASALALANWHAAHPFCARCGAATEPVQAGWLRRCTAEGSEHYPRTDVAVIMSVVDEQDRLLLAQGAGWGTGRYSVLAGFLEPGESLAAAVAREVHEEVGLEVADVAYLGDQPWPFPTSIMVGFTARARPGELRLQPSEIADARWFTRAQLRDGVADGSVGVSPRLSIARRIVEHWLGEELPVP